MIFPQKLKTGDQIRVVAPAKSFLPNFTKEMRISAQQRLEELGLKVTFGAYVDEVDAFDSTSIDHRLLDLHEAFTDKNVAAILSVQGGSQSNQLLKYLDYELIAHNPKIVCGMSDITALASAIYTKTGLVTYSGPGFTLFRDSSTVDYTTSYFQQMFFSEEKITIRPAESFSDKRSDTELKINKGYWMMNPGTAQGKIIGGNLITLNLLQGSPFMPDIAGSILFLEDNEKESYRAFANHLQALVNQPAFSRVQGLVIGRFQAGSEMTYDLLQKIIDSKKELSDIPVIANVDFGHTVPMITFPIGGEVILDSGKEAAITICKH